MEYRARSEAAHGERRRNYEGGSLQTINEWAARLTQRGTNNLTDGDPRGNVERKLGDTGLDRDGLQAVGRMDSARPSTVDSDGCVAGPAWDPDIVGEGFVSRDRRSERVAERVYSVDEHCDLVVCTAQSQWHRDNGE